MGPDRRNAVSTITINDRCIKTGADGLVSLTDLYAAARATGQAEGKRDPRRWKLQDGAPFIDFMGEQLNVPLRDIYRATKGKGGGKGRGHRLAK